MGKFEYLSGVIPLMVGEYIIIAALVLWLHDRRRIVLNKDREPLNLFHSFLNSRCFEDTYRSYIGTMLWNCVLLCFRLGCFLFFLIVPCIQNYVDTDGFDYKYFTQWNVNWITSYYFLATISSLIGVYNDRFAPKTAHASEQPLNGDEFVEEPVTNTVWSYPVQIIGHTAHVIFEIAGATALFVTVIDFTLLSGKFTFRNCAAHLITSLTLLVELSFNSIEVRWEHLLLNLSWALVYLFFIWPAVSLDSVKSWPYGFLNTSSPSCFAWYTFLFIVNVIFYGIWYGLYRLKVNYLAKEGPSRISSRTGVANDRVMTNDLELNCNEVPDAHCENHSPINQNR